MSGASAGAADLDIAGIDVTEHGAERRRPPSPARLSAVPAFGASLLLAAGCGGKGSTPTVLLDGSAVDNPRVVLEGVSVPAISTKLRIVPAEDVSRSSDAAACLRGPARGVDPRGPIVARLDVDAESVTVRDSGGVTACDGTQPGGEGWCGSSFGRLYGGHLRDPRLDVAGCTTSSGERVAFAWIEPDPGGKYVVVAEHGYAEVYEPAAGLPVRVSTREVRTGASGASFHVTEHDARGRLLRRLELTAVPAG